MRSFLFAALFLALNVSAFSQKSPVKFGKIPMEDMRMTVYEKDSSAGAVILVDFGKSYIQIQAQYSNVGAIPTLGQTIGQRNQTIVVTMTTERHVRFKILNKKGLLHQDLVNGKISLFHYGEREEKLKGLKAVTYNLENGKIVESDMPGSSIFKEKVNKFYDQIKFSFSNVKEGSVVEYSYSTVSDFFTDFPNWAFQKRVPVRWSEFIAIMPDDFSYQKYMQGYLPVKYEKTQEMAYGSESTIHHWISQDVPAFKAEPFMTSEKDYVSKINFALSAVNSPDWVTNNTMGTWEALTKQLMAEESFGKVITESFFLQSKVNELLTGMTEPLQKISAIQNYIKQNIEWDETSDFIADDLKKAFESKKGSSGDINLMLASMLNKSGIDVDMLLISTRDHGFIRKEFPMRRQFNYVICIANVNGKNLLLDATEKYLPMEVIPQRCLNGEGLIVSAKNSGWMNVSPVVKTRTTVNVDLALTDKGELKGKLIVSRDGYDALDMRKEYFSKGEEPYIKSFLGSREWSLEKTEFIDLKEVNKTAKEIYNISIDEHATASANVIYINPFIESRLQENPFKSEKREYPVDYGSPSVKSYFCKILIPDGFTVEELPKSQTMKLADNEARFVFNCVLSGNIISVTSSMQINKSIFLMEEYGGLREFYNQVIAKQAEQIVLKKK